MKKLYKNVISSALPQMVNILSNLILPGLIIAQFGSEINGLVSTTKTIVSYISLVGAGIATAVTQALYQPVANQDDLTTKGMLRTANGMFNRYGVIFLIITLLVSIGYPLAIRSDVPYLSVMLLLIVMSLSGASEFFAIGRCRAILYAHQKVYVCSIIQAASLLMSLGMAVLMLKLECGIILVQFTISFVYVLRGFLLTAYVRKCYPQYTDYRSAPPVPSAIQKRKDAMIHQLAGLVVTGSQAAILTFLVDLKAASIYSVYNIVLYGIRSICSNLCTAITPFLGKQYALGHKKQLANMYDAVEFVFSFAVTFVLMVTVAMLVPFVSLYTRGADIDYVFPIFALLFVVSSSFYILKLPGTSLISVAGHFKETKWRAILEAVLSVVLSFVLTIWLGMHGVLLGTGIALGWRCVDTIFYAGRRILQRKIGASVRRLCLSVVNILLFQAAVKWIPVQAYSWVDWILWAVLYAAGALIVLVAEAVLFERKALRIVRSYVMRKK